MSESDADNDYHFLKVGALLHDVGHVVPGLDGEEKGHSERGFEFLSSFASTELFSLFAKYHHALSIDEIKEDGLSQKEKNLLFMVSEASRLSLGDEANAEENDSRKHLLKSVFSGISKIRDNVEDFKPKFYEPKKLNPGVFMYPCLGADNPDLAKEGCSRIYESFNDFFGKLSGPGINQINEDLLLMFLEENTAFIPAGRGANEDISLFDHLKTACAIASCIYKFHERELDVLS
ncbi:HD domain-containing protein [Methanosarcina acetivorans]|nr:HD domain-containing protein [Methanosarcina acetivorans]